MKFSKFRCAGCIITCALCGILFFAAIFISFEFPRTPEKLFRKYMNTAGFNPENLTGRNQTGICGLSFDGDKILLKSLAQEKSMKLMFPLEYADEEVHKLELNNLQKRYQNIRKKIRMFDWPSTVSPNDVYISDFPEGTFEYLFEEEGKIYYLRIK